MNKMVKITVIYLMVLGLTGCATVGKILMATGDAMKATDRSRYYASGPTVQPSTNCITTVTGNSAYTNCN